MVNVKLFPGLSQIYALLFVHKDLLTFLQHHDTIKYFWYKFYPVKTDTVIDTTVLLL